MYLFPALAGLALSCIQWFAALVSVPEQVLVGYLAMRHASGSLFFGKVEI